MLYYTLCACQNTDQLYLFSFADDLSNKDKLQLFLLRTCKCVIREI